MNTTKIDFSPFSQGEETAVLPMSLVEGLVKSLPSTLKSTANRELNDQLMKAKTLAERADVLKTAYMVTALQVMFEERESEELIPVPVPVTCD